MRRCSVSNAARPGVVVAAQVRGLRPQRPVVRPDVERVQHRPLDHVDPGPFVHAVAGHVRAVLAVVAVLEDGREPRRPVRELLDLDRLVENHAVRAEPAARAHRQVVHLVVADAADVRLRVDGERGALPRLDLQARHLDRRALGGQVVGERARVVARVSLAPEAVHHEVHELDRVVAVELGGEELVQLAEGVAKGRVVVARLDLLGPAAAARADRDERDRVAQEAGQRELLRLVLGVRQLDAEAEAAAARPRGLAREREHRVQVEAAGAALHVAPVAADVEEVRERQRGHRRDLALERRAALARGERGPALLERVADEAEARVPHGGIGRRRGLDRVPALVLLDAERPLVQSVGHAWPGAEVVAAPEVRRHVGPRRGARSGNGRAGGPGLHEEVATFDHGLRSIPLTLESQAIISLWFLLLLSGSGVCPREGPK